ncbi:MAG: hypothetical protein IT373_37730 [Polyangiaceae bacterium]|nr:hypothetical protein [Polyangiaceae bacterium]
MKLVRLLLVVLVAAFFATALPSVARAQPDEPSEADKAQARRLGEEGQKALDQKNYEVAYDRFKRAESLFHAPTLLLGLARSSLGLGKVVQAQEAYNKIIREKLPKGAPDPFVRAQEDAKKEIVGLDQKIAWATITVTGPDKPKVTLDGEPIQVAALGVKRPVDPGEHGVKASAEGYLDAETTFSVIAGGVREVELAMQIDPEAGKKPPGGPDVPGDTGDPGAGQRIGGFVTLGIGGAALIVGAITGGLAVGKHGELEDGCQDGVCPKALEPTLDDYHMLGTVSTVGFVAGGVLAATGLIVALTAPSAETTGGLAPRVELALAPTHAGLRVDF